MATLKPSNANGSVRERIIGAAYGLFSAHGVAQVGIDTILAKSGCAKASLYNNFDSKSALALAFLERRQAVWTRDWFQSEIRRRSVSPRGRLLAIFDVLHEWFQHRDFVGCPFINVLLESKPDDPVRRAASDHLAEIRSTVAGLARDEGFANAEKFASVWHTMMKGSIVSAGEGNRDAAREAKVGARILLDNWKRTPKSTRR